MIAVGCPEACMTGRFLGVGCGGLALQPIGFWAFA